MYIYILHTSITSALSNVQRLFTHSQRAGAVKQDCYVEDPAEFLEEGQCFHNGFIGPVASPFLPFRVVKIFFLAKMDANSGYAKP